MHPTRVSHATMRECERPTRISGRALKPPSLLRPSCLEEEPPNETTITMPKYGLGRYENLVVDLDDSEMPIEGYWDMTVIVPVKYDFLTRTGDDVDDWFPHEETQWRRHFELAVADAWSYKFPLLGVELNPWPWQTAARVKVTVWVEVREATAFERKHSRLWVTRLDVFRTEKKKGKVDALFDPDKRLIQLNESDGESTKSRDKNEQIAAAHEIGHALGFDHSNIDDPGCGSQGGALIHDTNEGICYGLPDSRESANIMGRGMQITPDQYAVFVGLLKQFHDDYEFGVGPPENVHARSMFPRTGIQAGPMGGARPPGPIRGDVWA